jgi:predicted enzyme related to lactoylglutathione lyase
MPEAAKFCRYELRTTDVPAARSFYADLLGRTCDIVALPEQARARGARPHWLGHLGVADVERALQAFVERGATQLGPTRSVDGRDLAIVRDPGGAVVGLATPSPDAADPDIIWHGLNTDDLPRASAAYCELLGWRMTERLDLGPHGVFHHFTWNPDGASVGSFAAIAGRPGVHPHWLFHFRVAALEPAIAHVRAAGGLVAGTFVLPDGDSLAVCDDPQGAAFALRQPAPKVM